MRVDMHVQVELDEETWAEVRGGEDVERDVREYVQATLQLAPLVAVTDSKIHVQ